jgi:hypothetical protein
VLTCGGTFPLVPFSQNLYKSYQFVDVLNESRMDGLSEPRVGPSLYDAGDASGRSDVTRNRDTVIVLGDGPSNNPNGCRPTRPLKKAMWRWVSCEQFTPGEYYVQQGDKTKGLRQEGASSSTEGFQLWRHPCHEDLGGKMTTTKIPSRSSMETRTSAEMTTSTWTSTLISTMLSSESALLLELPLLPTPTITLSVTLMQPWTIEEKVAGPTEHHVHYQTVQLQSPPITVTIVQVQDRIVPQRQWSTLTITLPPPPNLPAEPLINIRPPQMTTVKFELKPKQRVRLAQVMNEDLLSSANTTFPTTSFPTRINIVPFKKAAPDQTLVQAAYVPL